MACSSMFRFLTQKHNFDSNQSSLSIILTFWADPYSWNSKLFAIKKYVIPRPYLILLPTFTAWKHEATFKFQKGGANLQCRANPRLWANWQLMVVSVWYVLFVFKVDNHLPLFTRSHCSLAVCAIKSDLFLFRMVCSLSKRSWTTMTSLWGVKPPTLEMPLSTMMNCDVPVYLALNATSNQWEQVVWLSYWILLRLMSFMDLMAVLALLTVLLGDELAVDLSFFLSLNYNCLHCIGSLASWEWCNSYVLIYWSYCDVCLSRCLWSISLSAHACLSDSLCSFIPLLV